MFFDELLQHLGEFGRYQRRVYFLACMMVIPTAWHIAIQVFTAGYTDHWCTIPEWEDTNCTKWNITDSKLCDETKRDAGIPPAPGEEFPYEQCSRYNLTGIEFYPGVNTSSLTDETLKCDAGWDYDTSLYKSTIITEILAMFFPIFRYGWPCLKYSELPNSLFDLGSTFDLVCSKSSYADLAQSVFFAGVVLGSLIFGSLADRIGRHPALFMAVAIQAFVGIAISFSPNFTVYTILRTVIGIGNQMVLVLAFVMGTEFVGPSKRVYAGVVISFFLGIGNMSLALLAIFIREWRVLQLVISAPAILSLCLYPFIPESVRWLISQGKHKKAKKLLNKVAKVNGVELPPELLSSDKMKEDEEAESSILDIWRYPETRLRMIICMWVAFVNSILYYGLTLSAGDLGELDFLAFFLSGAVEIPAYIFCLYFLDKWGRRPVQAMFFFISGIACLVTTFLPLGIANTVVSLIGKLGASGALCTSPFYTLELLPTPVRTAGMGLSTMAIGVGSILAPIIFLLAEYWEPIPMVILGTAGIFAGFPTMLLPETKGENLPETMEDGENFGLKPKKSDEDDEKKADANDNTEMVKNNLHVQIPADGSNTENDGFETDQL